MSNNIIKDIQPLKALQKLKYLSLNNNLLSNIDSLKELRNLESVDMRENKYLNYLPKWIVESHIEISVTNHFLDDSSILLNKLSHSETIRHYEEKERQESFLKYGNEDNSHLDSGRGYDENLDPDQQSFDYWEQF